MQVIHDLEDLRRATEEKLVLVPTMGGLHEGHSSLIKLATNFSRAVLVSVFINPLQFEDSKDMENYPQTPTSDIQLARRGGASVMWFPEVAEIYDGRVPSQSAGDIGDLFEGVSRLSHFSGMLTVVNRLFELTQPSWAIFGEKDFQQLFLIKKMVKRLSLPIEIIAAPTVREADGLAMSSRNSRLIEQDRAAASVLFRALSAAVLEKDLTRAKATILRIAESEPRFHLDYAEIIDEVDFTLATNGTVNPRALIAGWINGVRLIDNMPMGNFEG